MATSVDTKPVASPIPQNSFLGGERESIWSSDPLGTDGPVLPSPPATEPYSQPCSPSPALTTSLSENEVETSPVLALSGPQSCCSPIPSFQSDHSDVRLVCIRIRYVVKHIYMNCVLPDTVTVSQTRDLFLLRCDLWSAPPSFTKHLNRQEKNLVTQWLRNGIRTGEEDAMNQREEEEERHRLEKKWRSGFGIFYPATGHWLDDMRPLSYYGLRDSVFLELHHRSDFVRIPQQLYNEPYAQGYLYRRSRKVFPPSGWHRRWFVLQGTSLYSYRHRKDTEPLWSLELGSRFELRWHNLENDDYSAAIELKVTEKSLVLAAEEDRELRHWKHVFDSLSVGSEERLFSTDTTQGFSMLGSDSEGYRSSSPTTSWTSVDSDTTDRLSRLYETPVRNFNRLLSSPPRWKDKVRRAVSMLNIHRPNISTTQLGNTSQSEPTSPVSEQFPNSRSMSPESDTRTLKRFTSEQSLRCRLLRSRMAGHSHSESASSAIGPLSNPSSALVSPRFTNPSLSKDAVQTFLTTEMGV